MRPLTIFNWAVMYVPVQCLRNVIQLSWCCVMLAVIVGPPRTRVANESHISQFVVQTDSAALFASSKVCNAKRTRPCK